MSLLVPMLGCGEVTAPPKCAAGNETYVEGETFAAGDGCNTCSCQADGTIACSTAACIACEYQGEGYEIGASWPAGDGCNLCMCLGQDEVSCTTANCGGDNCVYAGIEKQPGSTFDALDGCNTCTCERDGTVSCTEESCPCDPAAEWYRDYVSQDVRECAVIDFACPDNTTGFENACGCGCEQHYSCAQQYDCAPPQECDVEQIEADCPFSEIILE